ncbi:DUF1414 domain-containing protein [Psychrosphaera aquimarina]|jgi:uncharacterized protein YejL (UPF0352 family)|uniref:UPF0352 protein RT723_17630 n=1 Tax=Psychrosphaera aquimarina TaxID=2044854 RepID=A0ABU3R526_9GAMM|nr:DUF1414 domain-containing protein [Psychrosphaera aquimarina]MDU0114778.1 DUF1414 domain-containing protein [Psychrosphaera aquimarina]
MPIISKYSNDEINNLVEEIISVIQANKAPVDLALIALGNTVSNVIDDNVSEKQKMAIAKSFSDALLASMAS